MDTRVATPSGKLAQLLADVEWSAGRSGQRFGDLIGSPFKACPICWGVAPDQGAEKEFSPTSIGHQTGCRMVEGLRFVAEQNL